MCEMKMKENIIRKAIVVVSEKSRSIADTLKAEMPDADIIDIREASLKLDAAEYDAYIFISAMGICVRTIAPFVADKHTDPAIVCVDALAQNAVSVLSGHVGGANELTLHVAHILGAHPVITTQSDCQGTWALDTIAERFGWKMWADAESCDDKEISDDNTQLNINLQISLFTSCRPTALLLEIRDRGTEWLERNLPGHVQVFSRYEDIDQSLFELLVIVSPFAYHEQTLPLVQYVPKVVSIGVGLAHQASPAGVVCDEILATLRANGIIPMAVAKIATIIEKRDEPALAHLAGRLHLPVDFYSADELKLMDVPNPSDTVSKYMSTPSVSEAAALLAAGYRKGTEYTADGCNGKENSSDNSNANEISSAPKGLILQKQKGANWTVAAAILSDALREGHVEFVGAGPGDPDLVSVRGRQMLEKADLILYAGSLVPRQLTDCAKAGAVVRSSASMALEEQVSLMKEYYDQGKFVVRLHTGDPCLYGAIQEQMNFLDRWGMQYHITPGISAFQAAAAELKSQFTIPRKTQTIILTRGEGRTPMPDLEKLHLLARSQSTMCIYLSADIVEKVQAELMQEYPADTPVAVCYRLTWKEQQIWRGELKDLVDIVRGNGLTLDTLMVVGEAIGNRKGLSELYSKHFTHLFRKAEDGEEEADKDK